MVKEYKFIDKSDLIRKFRARKAVEYLNKEQNRLLFFLISSASTLFIIYVLLRYIYGN